IIVGVNKHQPKKCEKAEILKIDDSVSQEQIGLLNKVKTNRNNEKVRERLENLKRAAEGTENLMPYIIEAVKEYASVGEITGALKEVFGTYREDSIF
ncbi:MAG: methylmalonyl-CoA mutase, partial [Candidatus Lokiarchaeota archaeon]|nr:methylmalonyl-CoA mutase [Candidatus Lokiarchaeota archaeon]